MRVDAQPDRRRLVMRFAISTTGRAFLDAMQGWLDQHPEAVGYDWLYDMRIYHGTVSHDDITQFARLYATIADERDAGRYAIFVSSDAAMPLWIRACALHFPRRILTVVRSMAEAEKLLRREPD
ncbi:hypothetical protein [Roseococcus pinisoli]|uniref:Uncharacterized protein n=1 Tax=Roseococcus pinisoli TaxID=2835040 RepID=A0ABS5QKK8_9PROT|nr:hypothetical protein [Roseococcus pinisoli]MBS7813530.1 hypothetical protein [Roseococcus pinisoli]